MTGILAALAVGTLLSVGALAFVLYPLFFPTRGPSPRSAAMDATTTDDSAIVALREIEFDRATGKLSETDYAELRRNYGERALGELRSTNGRAASAAPADPVEARVHAYRQARLECPTCGLRPESDAIYCSSCGTRLARA